MSTRIRALEAKRKAAIEAAAAINSAVEAAGRDILNEDEQAKFDAHMAEAAGLKAQIERQRALDLAEAGITASGASSVEIPENAKITVTERLAEDPKRGFKSVGDFAVAVMRSSSVVGTRAVDQRLTFEAAAPSTYGSEGVGTDGGFLVPPDFAKEIFNLSVLTEQSILPRVDNVTTASNSMVFPKDETTPWGTDGVRAYWQQEATAATATKPKFGTTILRLHKLMALVPITEELQADQSALASYLPGLMARSITWKTNEAMLWGDGAGQPLGAFSSGAAVTVAKDSGQATSTLSITNITGMVARLPPGSLGRAFWMVTPDAIPALFGLTIGNVPAYMPLNQGLQQSPTWMLLGLPVVVSQHAKAFSAGGDILLMDGTYYRALTARSGVEMASSMHLYFDAAAIAFRTMFRVDGQPKIAAPITQAKGSNQLSPFVQLAAR